MGLSEKNHVALFHGKRDVSRVTSEKFSISYILM